MNPIPDDDELKRLAEDIARMYNEGKTCDNFGNVHTADTPELERLDRKYAPLFEKLEGKE